MAAAGDEDDNGRSWEVVSAGSTTYAAANDGNDDFAVFPPSLHEGLAPTLTLDPPSNQQPIREKQEEEEVEAAAAAAHVSRTPISVSVWRVVDSAVEVVRSKITNLKGGGGGGVVWSFAALAGLAGVLMYMRRRQLRERELLFFLILEKDQRISQLVHQIVQLSEIVAAQHRVPVLKT